MLAYDYPLLGIFWSLVMFSVLVIVIFTVIYAFIDNFRRRDHSGWAKAFWALLIVILPLLGTLIYLVARPATVDIAVAD
ncbi:MAG TPA: PLDc N-terminal domain-containing protein [Acidimicrobiales bacterium]|nr:PLDc N-terminal domain-containing protein [Acidimicrobiales bacterium]